MRVGRDGTNSKSVVVFLPTAGDDRAIGDLPPNVLLGGANVPMVESFCHLPDEFAVESRISRANR